MTINLGTRDISKGLSVGFARGNDATGDYDRMKANVTEELEQHFRRRHQIHLHRRNEHRSATR